MEDQLNIQLISEEATKTTPPTTQQPPNSENPSPPENIRKLPAKNILFIIVSIIVVLAISTIGILAMQQEKNEATQQLSSQSAINPINTPTTTPINISNSATENIPSSKSNIETESQIYTSENLGLTFSYAPTYSSWNYIAYILEEGNKIYIGPKRYYEDNLESFKSEFIEVFTVEEGLSVKEDIQKRFMSEYSSKDCYVTDPTETNDPKNTSSAYPLGDNYRLINIEASSSKEDMEVWMEAIAKCPQPYTASNGISYFAYDINRPNMYIFYSIGQQAPWPASTKSYGEDGSGISWIQTIKFAR